MSGKKSWVWNFFTIKAEGKASCNSCATIIKCAGFSTSSMISHLSSQHGISKPTVSHVLNESSSFLSSANSSESRAIIKPSPGTALITKYLKKQSLSEILAECAAENGFSVSGILKCKAIRGYLRSLGMEMPKSATTIWERIIEFYAIQIDEQKKKIIELKTTNNKFSITLDEWTDLTSHRYLMINLHTDCETFQLKLIPIPAGSCTAQVLFKLVVKELMDNGLEVQSDLIATTSDGAKVMGSYGNLMDIIVQFCINHGLHLAVVDTLYQKKSRSICQPENIGSRQIIKYF